MNYYPFHIGDYATASRNLSLMEDLAYRRLLDLYYDREAPIPDDIERVSRLIGMRKHQTAVLYVLSEFFLKSDAVYINPRCDGEISKYQAKAERAKKANLSRWSDKKSKVRSNRKSNITSEVRNDLDPNQEPITNNQDKPPLPPLGESFKKFWKAYPKKKSKGQAEKAFFKLKPNEQLVDVMIAAVERATTSENWVKDNGQFIPNPATWINAKGWEDEYPDDDVGNEWDGI
jgi:uncharacterized protein YdaU (DUF1376 family)